MTMNFENLFPTAVGRLELPDSITKREFEYINALPRRGNQGNNITIDTNIFQDPELKRLGTMCENAAKEYLKTVYAPQNNINLYITQSWANYTDENQSHHRHLHSNSLISGVLYVSTDESTDKIHFYKDTTRSSFVITPKEYNQWNSDTWWFPVKPNTILLFPSYLLHSVEPKTTPNTRISISFNTFFKGSIGDPLALNQLIL
jgi:uncharacterized protein (TIGR02466 family)